MFTQLENTALLRRRITVKIRQNGRESEKSDQFVLNPVRSFRKLCIRPAENTPALIYHTVLFQQVIDILIL